MLRNRRSTQCICSASAWVRSSALANLLQLCLLAAAYENELAHLRARNSQSSAAANASRTASPSKHSAPDSKKAMAAASPLGSSSKRRHVPQSHAAGVPIHSPAAHNTIRADRASQRHHLNSPSHLDLKHAEHRYSSTRASAYTLADAAHTNGANGNGELAGLEQRICAYLDHTLSELRQMVCSANQSSFCLITLHRFTATSVG